ncbi:MAG: hypothetical protein ABEJ87_05635 [Candidatus Nanohalobium sp.]
MKKLSGLIVFLLLIGSVSAFQATVHRPDPTASPDSPALIQVKVNNTYNQEVGYSIGVFSPKPSWIYTEESKTLKPGEVHNFDITVTPGKYAVDNTYSFSIYVKASGINESKKLKSSFHVKRSRKLILEDFSLENTSYMPGDSLKGSMKIRSISSNVLKNYRAVFSYKNFSTTEKSSPILPGGTRELEFTLPVKKGEKPGIYGLNASLQLGGSEVRRETRNFSVGKVTDINVKENTQDNILTYRGSISVRNEGNAKENYTVNRTVASYLAPITGFSKSPDSADKNGPQQVYYWKTSLEPGEEFTLTRTTNYWMPGIALIGIIVALAALKKLSNTVEIRKTVEDDPEGLKVSIEIENISDRTLTHATVEDFIPDIAEVDKDFEMGAPTVRRTNDGTKLVWGLEDLEPGDQRILQYVIRPKVEVEGGAELQEAVLKEKDEVIKKSDKVETNFRP